MNHTPGPWTTEYYDDTGWSIYDEAGDVIQPTEANSRLIAAAPELLDILKKAFRTYETMTSHDFALGKDKPMRDAMRAALMVVLQEA